MQVRYLPVPLSFWKIMTELKVLIGMYVCRTIRYETIRQGLRRPCVDEFKTNTLIFLFYPALAHLVEPPSDTRKVLGSNPRGRTRLLGVKLIRKSTGFANQSIQGSNPYTSTNMFLGQYQREHLIGSANLYSARRTHKSDVTVVVPCVVKCIYKHMLKLVS